MNTDAELSTSGSRTPPRMVVGWVALAFFVFAVVMALLKINPVGFACVAVGGILSVAALVLEYRRRQAVTRSAEQVFPEFGTFGAPRSRQTHTPF